jgi:glycosyltransferase involved in cell wall biosynthesis
LVNRSRKLVSFVRRWAFLLRYAIRIRPEFLQARDNTTEAFMAWTVARLIRTRFVYQIDYWHPEAALYAASLLGRSSWAFQRKWHWQIFLREFLLRRADLVFVISEAMREHYAARGLRQRTCVFPVGVSERFWAPLPTREELRRRHGLDARPILAYIGSLDPLRRPTQIFDIIEGVAGALPNVGVLILSREIAVAERELAQRGLSKNIVMLRTATHEELPELLGVADIGLFPLSEDDPFGIFHTASPLKIGEYMACRVMPVSSRNPEVVDLFEQAGVGVTCPDSTEAFVAACVSLLEDREALAVAGERARQYARRFKSCEAIAAVVEHGYGRLLGPTAADWPSAQLPLR